MFVYIYTRILFVCMNRYTYMYCYLKQNQLPKKTLIHNFLRWKDINYSNVTMCKNEKCILA